MPGSTDARTALVSGGGTGIGAATAAALAGEVDRLVLIGRRPAPLEQVAAEIARPGLEVHTRSVNSADAAAVAELADWAGAELGRLDIIVANAGSPQQSLGTDLGEIAAAWEATFRANALSAVLLVEGLQALLPRPGGRIVIVGSAAAATGNGSPAYAAAKGALQTYAVSLMKRLGPEGITANVIAPGYTDGTELVAGRISPERRSRLLSGIAVGRPAEPAEIAHLIVALCSPAAGFVNGQTLRADGGPIVPG